MEHQYYPLSGDLKARAEYCFQLPMDGVTLILGDQPARRRTLAFARGTQVWLDPKVMSMPQLERDLIIGHELAHVAQFMEGRIKAEDGQNHVCDPASEAEAHDLGRCFARGGRRPFGPGPLIGHATPATQNLIFLGDQQLTSTDQLPLNIRLIIDLISGGTAWLQWAVTTKEINLPFPDSDDMVVEIQKGLHGTPIMLINELALMTHPMVLLFMDQCQITAVSAYVKTLKSGSATNAVVDLEMERALEAFQLLRQSDLVSVDDFLKQVELDQAPLFQKFDLQDRLVLYYGISNPISPLALDPKFQKEAASFAIRYSATASAFADFYRYYMFMLLNNSGETAVMRARRADMQMVRLERALANFLQCPDAPAMLDAAQMRVFMEGAGPMMPGFARMSRGVMALSKIPVLWQMSDEELAEAVPQYFTQAHELITTHTASRPVPLQSGIGLLYPIQGKAGRATLSLETEGHRVSLHDYVPLAPS